MVHESRRVVHLMIEVLRIRLLEVLVVRHRVEEIVVLLLLLRHWELLLRLLLRCLVRSVSSSWSRCVRRRREAQLLHIFFFVAKKKKKDEAAKNEKNEKNEKSRMSNSQKSFAFFQFSSAKKSAIDRSIPLSLAQKKWFARYFSNSRKKRQNWPQSGNSRHSWLTPPLSYIHTHTPSRICFKVVHSFGVHIKYFNTDWYKKGG